MSTAPGTYLNLSEKTNMKDREVKLDKAPMAGTLSKQLSTGGTFLSIFTTHPLRCVSTSIEIMTELTKRGSRGPYSTGIFEGIW